MRTTLTIDDDILSAAKARAERERRTVGEVISELARKALTTGSAREAKGGFPVLPVSNPDAVVTTEIINRLREELD